MKQKAFFLVILLVVVVLIIGIVRMFLGKSPKQGDLRVDSTPVASVFLDNKHIGRTPLGATSYKVDAGEYTIKIVPESATTQYASWQGKIRITPNVLTYVNATLAESELASAIDVLWLEKTSGSKGELSVTTTPDSATVTLDDEMKGMTPISIPDITAGSHTITIASQGFVTRTLKVQITAGYRLITAVKLALASGVSSPEASPEASPSATPKTTGKPTPATSLVEPEKPYALIKDTPTGYLNVRLDANKTASKAGEVKPGEMFAFTKTATDSAGTVWYEIKYDGTNLGWISGQYVTKVE
ncbi:MAG: PEGA domain-containing protein [Candidatus Roizmanbacteria bacterium]|nr:PEGA domain-containing protein [Candidatus Roizmanbacteria bacterium]